MTNRTPNCSDSVTLAGSTLGCVDGSGFGFNVSLGRTQLLLVLLENEPHGVRCDADVHEVERLRDGALAAGPAMVEIVAAEHSADAHMRPPQRNVRLKALVGV